LVADSLEDEWNNKLRALAAAQEDYERHRNENSNVLTTEQRQQVMTLVTDLPRLWSDPATPNRERKRMVRLLLEDVTLLKAEEVIAHLRFRGGATQTIRLPRPKPAHLLRRTDPEVIAEIDRLLEEHPDAEIASILNMRGLRPGHAKTMSEYDAESVTSVVGHSDVCCSSNPSRMTMESRNVPGTTNPKKPMLPADV
jgi:hypothetical protein